MEQEKKPAQNVNFQSFSELIGFLPENQLEIFEQLRFLVLDTLPSVQERLSYNVPFYKIHKGICYIWPGAVSWGSKILDGVEFGFNYGYLLADEANYLDRGNRKQVYNKRFISPDEINEDLLRAYLIEAAEIDEMMFREKMSAARNRKKKK